MTAPAVAPSTWPVARRRFPSLHESHVAWAAREGTLKKRRRCGRNVSQPAHGKGPLVVFLSRNALATHIVRILTEPASTCRARTSGPPQR